MNKLSCSRLDDRGDSTPIARRESTFFDWSDGEFFARTKRRQSDSFFTTTLLTQSAVDTGNITVTRKEQQLNRNFCNGNRNACILRYLGKGYIDGKIMRLMLSLKRYSMNSTDKPHSHDFSTCMLTKHTKPSCKEKLMIESKIITIHADICGLIRITTNGGSRYFLIMTKREEWYLSLNLLGEKGSL